MPGPIDPNPTEPPVPADPPIKPVVPRRDPDPPPPPTDRALPPGGSVVVRPAVPAPAPRGTGRRAATDPERLVAAVFLAVGGLLAAIAHMPEVAVPALVAAWWLEGRPAWRHHQPGNDEPPAPMR